MPTCYFGKPGGLLLSDCCSYLLKERSSETVFVVSDDLLAQTLRTAYMRSAQMLLVKFKFYIIWVTVCLIGSGEF